MERIALKFGYDGSAFHGFQRQPDLRTVEGELLDALRKLGLIEDPKKNRYSAASRTDRGVSALGNVIAFDTDKPELARPRIINSELPDDIFAHSWARVEPDFHPRRRSSVKWYRYFLPKRRYIDTDLAVRAASIFQGEHDFSSFCRKDERRSKIRRIDRIEISLEKDFLIIDVWGKSFLWEMVRRIVSAIELAGSGELELDMIDRALKGEIALEIPPAPPENLLLVDIRYDGVRFSIDDYSLGRISERLAEALWVYRSRSRMLEDILEYLENLRFTKGVSED